MLAELAIVLHAAATAQVGTGQIWYEASDDGGSTWARDYLLTSQLQESVLVRIRATWSEHAGMYAFAGTQFDISISNAGSDTVENPRRPWPFHTGSAQTIVASYFGSTIKIDDSRDTLGPGMGTRGVFPGQLVQNFAGTNFSSANPATIFEFELFFGDRTIRTLRSFYVMPSGAPWPPPRVMRVYTSPAGAQNTPQTDTFGIIIDNYTPAPGGVLLGALAGAMMSVRRRRPALKA